MSNLELKKGTNIHFGIDVSASMQTTDCANGASRIEYLKEGANTLIKEAAKWDEDGIDVYTFGAKVKHLGAITPEKAAELIAPLKATEGTTDTAALVQASFDLHRKQGKEQTVLLVATDGEPNNEEALFKTIAGITEKLKDEHEFAISFLTVGVRSPGLEAFLTKLDDNLPGAKYDIVDVKALNEVDFLEAFTGALHD